MKVLASFLEPLRFVGVIESTDGSPVKVSDEGSTVWIETVHEYEVRRRMRHLKHWKDNRTVKLLSRLR